MDMILSTGSSLSDCSVERCWQESGCDIAGTGADGRALTRSICRTASFKYLFPPAKERAVTKSTIVDLG